MNAKQNVIRVAAQPVEPGQGWCIAQGVRWGFEGGDRGAGLGWVTSDPYFLLPLLSCFLASMHRCQHVLGGVIAAFCSWVLTLGLLPACTE